MRHHPAILATLLFASSVSLKAACHAPPKPQIGWVGAQTSCTQSSPCAAGEPITFFATTLSGGFAACDVFDWDFGDNTAHSSARTPTHVFASGGKFTVLLKVSNETGPSQFDGDGLTILPATAFPSVEFTVSKNLVKVGDTIVFSWSTRNTTKGIRIQNAQPSSFQPVLISDPRSSGTTTLIAKETMAYTITAFGDAAQYTPLTPITVQVVGSAKGRAVRH